MVPRPFDPDVVQSRLGLMIRLIEDLDNVGVITAHRLGDDRIVRHAVERILSQLVELAVSVNGHVAATVIGEAPKDYRSSFDLAAAAGLLSRDLARRLHPSVGMRNVLAHDYGDIDLKQVANAAHTAPLDYGEYVREAASWLRSRADAPEG